MAAKGQIPLVTCSRKECEGCDIRDRILCVASIKDVIDFFMLFMVMFVPFMAGMIIGQFWLGIIAWFVLAAVFFGYVEALVLCRHCPHYGEPGFLLRCHANWGLPKIPKFSPKPMSKVEKVVWLLYAGVLLLWYVPFFVISGQWLLLLLTTVGLVSSVWTVMRTQCTRCYNLSCPMNRVPPDVREKFFRNYPVFARAWTRQ
jgi:hypothetical protein